MTRTAAGACARRIGRYLLPLGVVLVPAVAGACAYRLLALHGERRNRQATPGPTVPVRAGAARPLPVLAARGTVVSGRPSRRSPLRFFVLVYALSIPFWLVHALVPAYLPVDNLPVTDIGATFVPMVAASLLVLREEGAGGVRRFLLRAVDLRRIGDRRWYLAVVGLMPLLYVLTYGVMRLAGLPVPTRYHIPRVAPFLFAVFLFAAAGEELGYTGYATDPMQERWGAVPGALLTGTVHAVWHYPSGYAMGQTPALMAWGSLLTIAFRVLTVWLYTNTNRSVGATILFHAITNTGRSVFPGSRPALELADGAVGYSIIALAAGIAAFLWGPTLARFRYARAPA